MRNCICKLKPNNTIGTGFFCSIPYGPIKTMNCLITNNHVLNEEYYNNNSKITLLLDDDNSTVIIDITKERKTYFDKEYDITLIELIDNDKIDYFLELDDILKKEIICIEEIYKNNSVYIIQYPEGKKAHVSYGIINQIDEFKIKHLCCTKNGSSGSPILNLENNKIIGIHTFSSQNASFNGGTLLKFLLGNITYKTKQNNKNINGDIIDETRTIKEPHNNQGSWLYIFNQVINDYQYEKKNLTESEINEIVKDKIKEIKLLYKIFKIFIGVKENSKRKSSIEAVLNLMLSSIIGIKIWNEEETTGIDFHAIEERFKTKIKNGSMIRELTDAKLNYEYINKLYFGASVYGINYNTEDSFELFTGYCIWKTLGKMAFENNYSYNREKELNKVFENVIDEVISDIKNRNNYIGKRILVNKKCLIADEIYPNIIDKFKNCIKKYVCQDKENENLEKSLIDKLKRICDYYLKNPGIIYPIQYNIKNIWSIYYIKDRNSCQVNKLIDI